MIGCVECSFQVLPFRGKSDPDVHDVGSMSNNWSDPDVSREDEEDRAEETRRSRAGGEMRRAREKEVPARLGRSRRRTVVKEVVRVKGHPKLATSRQGLS